MEVNTVLKVRLLELGVSQVELARKLEITPGRLSGYINGYVRTPPEIDRQIRAALVSFEQRAARNDLATSEKRICNQDRRISGIQQSK